MSAFIVLLDNDDNLVASWPIPPDADHHPLEVIDYDDELFSFEDYAGRDRVYRRL